MRSRMQLDMRKILEEEQLGYVKFEIQLMDAIQADSSTEKAADSAITTNIK